MEPKKPWRLDTNERYLRVVQTLISLSTASLVLPIFFARNLLGYEKGALIDHLRWQVYSAWALLGLSVLSGIIFHYLSAKWVHLAWGARGREVSVLLVKVSEDFVGRALEVAFWITVVAFIVGLALFLWFFVTYVPQLPART